jgi:hypothetical protein
MQPWVEAQRVGLMGRRREILEGLRVNRIARNREFASVLHSAGRMREILSGIGNRSWGGVDTLPAAPSS